jgi:hypothetical protein
MPKDVEKYQSILAAISTCWKEQLSPEFIEYDTKYDGGNYPLPEGKLILLFLITRTEKLVYCWTTVRRWTPDKEEYYRKHLGEDAKIKIEEEQHGGNPT